MLEMTLQWISTLCLLVGTILIVCGGIGILRFPDFFTRLHASGVTETMAAGLILLGLMIMAGWGIVLFKLIIILLFILITSPTACHALAKSALHGNLDPVLHDQSDMQHFSASARNKQP